MTELPLKWKEIFEEMANVLEDLYFENEELKVRVSNIEKDIDLLKSYAWEQ